VRRCARLWAPLRHTYSLNMSLRLPKCATQVTTLTTASSTCRGVHSREMHPSTSVTRGASPRQSAWSAGQLPEPAGPGPAACASWLLSPAPRQCHRVACRTQPAWLKPARPTPWPGGYGPGGPAAAAREVHWQCPGIKTSGGKRM
jgi:hypothetical protein